MEIFAIAELINSKGKESKCLKLFSKSDVHFSLSVFSPFRHGARITLTILRMVHGCLREAVTTMVPVTERAAEAVPEGEIARSPTRFKLWMTEWRWPVEETAAAETAMVEAEAEAATDLETARATAVQVPETAPATERRAAPASIPDGLFEIDLFPEYRGRSHLPRLNKTK